MANELGGSSTSTRDRVASNRSPVDGPNYESRFIRLAVVQKAGRLGGQLERVGRLVESTRTIEHMLQCRDHLQLRIPALRPTSSLAGRDSIIACNLN